jgi:hypothetical protein
MPLHDRINVIADQAQRERDTLECGEVKFRPARDDGTHQRAVAFHRVDRPTVKTAIELLARDERAWFDLRPHGIGDRAQWVLTSRMVVNGSGVAGVVGAVGSGDGAGASGGLPVSVEIGAPLPLPNTKLEVT